MVYAMGAFHPVCVTPAGQYGSDSTAIPAAGPTKAGAGAGAGSAESPRTAKLCGCKSRTADRHDIFDLNAHCTKGNLK